MATSPVEDVLKIGSDLATLTKSIVDTKVNTAASDNDRKAGILGFMSLLSSGAAEIADRLKQPGVVQLFKNAGGGLALASLALTIPEFNDAHAAYAADPTIDNFNNLLAKSASLTGSLGGFISVLPGGAIPGGVLWLGSTLVENYFNGNFGVATGMAWDSLSAGALKIGDWLRPFQTQPRIWTGTWSPDNAWATTYANNRTPEQNVALGMSPDGYPLESWTSYRLSDGTLSADMKVYVRKEGDQYHTYFQSGNTADGTRQISYRVSNAKGEPVLVEMMKQDVPNGPMVVFVRMRPPVGGAPVQGRMVGGGAHLLGRDALLGNAREAGERLRLHLAECAVQRTFGFARGAHAERSEMLAAVLAPGEEDGEGASGEALHSGATTLLAQGGEASRGPGRQGCAGELVSRRLREPVPHERIALHQFQHGAGDRVVEAAAARAPGAGGMRDDATAVLVVEGQ